MKSSPLSNLESRRIFILALLSCIVATKSLVIVVNQTFKLIDEARFTTMSNGLLLIVLLFIVPMIIENIYKIGTNNNENDLFTITYTRFREVFFGLSIIFTVFYVISESGSHLSVIGLSMVSDLEALDLVCYGVLIWLTLGFVFLLVDKLVLPNDSDLESSKDVVLYLHGRTIAERIISAIILPISVFSEEILFRGYIVLYLGNVKNSLILYGFTSVVLSVISHLYQGKGRILSNLIFAAAMVVITIVTGKILLSTTIHMLNNYLVLFARCKMSNLSETS